MAVPSDRSPALFCIGRRGAARRRVVIGLAVAGVVGAASAGFYARGRGYKSWLAHKFLGSPALFTGRPSVTTTRPPAYDSTMPLDVFVAADVDLPNSGAAIDPKTVNLSA